MGLLVFLFILMPFVDLFLLVRVGRVIGFAPTLGLVVAMGFLGAMLAKSEGRRMLQQWQSAVAQGRVPEEGIIGGVLALIGALFLIAPGLLTDVVGLALLLPVLRRPLARLVSAYLARQLASGRVRVVSMNGPRPSIPPERETEVGRVRFRPGDVIDTDGEEVK